MARSELRRCPPRRPLRRGVQAAIASEDNHTVTSPRRTRARLYAGQFATRYFVLYVGWTFNFIPVVWLLRSVPRSPPTPQGLHATTPRGAAGAGAPQARARGRCRRPAHRAAPPPRATHHRVRAGWRWPDTARLAGTRLWVRML